MMALRILTAYTLVVSGLMLKPVNAHAQYARGNDMTQARDRFTDYSSHTVTDREIELLISFKSYILYIIHLQSSKIRHNLRCLGYSNYANEYLENEENEELKALLLDVFENYQEDGNCEDFLTKTIPALHESYRIMKTNLALHNGTRANLGTSVVGNGLNMGSGFDPVVCTLDNDDDFDEETQSCFQVVQDRLNLRSHTDCASIEVPFRYNSTEFCFRWLRTIADVKPTHPVTRISIGPLDSLFSSNELPMLKEFNPLSFDELDEVAYTFADKYNNNPYISELAERMSSENGNYIRLEDLEPGLSQTDKLAYAKYLTARDHQSPGVHLFSDYKEGSAPWLYSQELVKFPVLAFYKPTVGYHNEDRTECLDTQSSELTCDSEDFVDQDINHLCSQYKESLNELGYGSNVCDYHNNKDLADAYKASLDLNSQLIARFKSDDFNSDAFRDASQGELYSSIDLKWVKLLKLSAALKSFQSEEINKVYEGHEARFLQRLQSRQMRIIGFSIAGLVGLSILCGYLSGGLLVVACLGTAGIGANLAFYNDSLDKYEHAFAEFFANPGSETEETMSLIEFDSFKAERQALLMEVAFVGVGLSIKDIFNRSLRMVRSLKSTSNIAQ